MLAGAVAAVAAVAVVAVVAVVAAVAVAAVADASDTSTTAICTNLAYLSLGSSGHCCCYSQLFVECWPFLLLFAAVC